MWAVIQWKVVGNLVFKTFIKITVRDNRITVIEHLIASANYDVVQKLPSTAKTLILYIYTLVVRLFATSRLWVLCSWNYQWGIAINISPIKYRKIVYKS